MNSTTSDTRHPDDATLQAWRQTPQAADLHSVALHLAGCRECRSVVDAQARLQEMGADLPLLSCDETEQTLVDELVYGQPDAGRRQSLLDQIRKKPAMLQSALYALAHRPHLSEPETPQQAAAPSLSSRLAQYAQKFTAGWMAIPATALATLLVTFLALQLWPANTPTQQLLAYQDDPSLHFIPVSRMPGIGFFSAAHQRSQAFGGVNIEWRDPKVTLSWPAIDSAISYHLSLHGFSQGKKRLLKSIESTKTSATIKLAEKSGTRRFEWTLSGKTADKEQFFTRGGFVLRSDKP